MRSLDKEANDREGRSRWGRDSEVGSETAIHSVIQARPWARGEGPKRKCAIDPGGFLCGCGELVGAETTECAGATGGWSPCHWTETRPRM